MDREINIAAIEEYREKVENAAKRKSKLIFPNSTAIHANIVMTNIFKESKNAVRIYDSNLSGDIADLDNNEDLKFLVTEHKESIRNFLKSGKTLKVIVKSKGLKSDFMNFISTLQNDYPSTVILKVGNNVLSKEIKMEFGHDINFTIGDDRIFRQENNDNEEVRDAICSFNNKLFVSRLSHVFDAHFRSLGSFS